MAIILDGTTGLSTPGVTDTGNLSVTGTSTLTGGISGAAVNLATNVTGTLPIANGGTGTTSTTFVNAATNVTGTLPIANGGTGTTSTTFVNAATNVTGTLPIANGGTGTTSTTFVNAATNVTGTLPIANGGTNSTATATAGGVAYGTGTSIAVNSAGTSGYFLKSNGSSAPSWVAPSSGALVYISTVTASSSSTVSVSLGSEYENYLLVANGVTSSTAQVILQMRFGGITANYKFKVMTISSDDSGFYGSGASGQSQISLSYSSAASGTTSSMNFAMRIANPANTTFMKSVSWDGVNVANRVETMMGVGSNTSTGALTSLVFFFESGNISAGTFRLYGIANS